MYEPKWQEHMKIIESTIFFFEKTQKNCLSHFWDLYVFSTGISREMRNNNKQTKKKAHG